MEAIAAVKYRAGAGAYLSGAPPAWTRANDILALGPAMLPRVLELLWFERWSDPAELSALLMSLTLFGSGSAVPPLAALLEEDVPDVAKERIAETLGRLDHPTGMPVLAQLLADAHSPVAARREAARWLGIRGVTAAKPLLEQVASDAGEDAALRDDAAEALRRPISQ